MTVAPKFDIIDGDWPEAGRIEGDGFTVHIMYDDCPDSPRDMTDCSIGTMLCAHPNYQLGDIQAPQPFDTSITCPVCDGSGEMEKEFEDGEETCHACDGDGEIVLPIYDYLKREYGATVVLPLFLYDHSGISMSCGANMGPTESSGVNPFDSAGWDTSMVGFIFDTPEQLEKTGCPVDQIEIALRAEIDEYDDYLRGNVFYVTTDIDGMDYVDGTCGGFVGHKYASEQAIEFAEDADKVVQNEREQRAEWEARGVETV